MAAAQGATRRSGRRFVDRRRIVDLRDPARSRDAADRGPASRRSFRFTPLIAAALLALTALPAAAVELLNVSYDPTRELYRAINEAFTAKSKALVGEEVTVRQSHGGSGSQARAVIDGLEADVVTLAIPTDIDAIAKAGLLPADWATKLPNDSLPYTSTIVFVVRKGNPKGIKDWQDLVKPGIEIITPNPKTSGNGKLSFLAAWGSVTQRGGSEEEALAFVKKLYAQVPVLDLAARASTVTFLQKKIGDVHLAWENEAYLEVEESKGKVEIVVPPISILAEPSVAVVTKNTDHRGTTKAATEYLKFLYTPEAQTIIAKNYYRPTDPAVIEATKKDFPSLTLFPVTKIAPSWNASSERFFAEGKVFDQLYGAGGAPSAPK